MELTEKEVEIIKYKWDFSLNDNSSELILKDIKDKDEKISGCKVTLGGNGASSKSNDVLTFLEKLFSHENSINREKYREGFLKKCRNNENSLTLTLESGSEINKKLNELFDFSRELSKKIYEDIKVTNKTMSIEDKIVKITVNAALNNQKYECKIIGAPKNESEESVTFDQTDLTIQMQSFNNEEWKKLCGNRFNDEITIELNKKTSDNKYNLGSLLTVS